MKTNSEYFPKDRPIWLVFDLNNGHKGYRRYVWWFDTRKEALEHIKEQKQRFDHHEPVAQLSKPLRFYPEIYLPKFLTVKNWST